jgi:hypothetical protein
MNILRFLVSAINESAPPAHQLVCACNVSFDPTQEWSTIRFGVYPNEVGLQVFDRPAAEAMVSAFNSTLNRLARAFRGLPGYIGHPDEPAWLARNPNARRDAVSRVKELRITDDGLQFRTAYNDDGKKLLTGEAPAFDAFSPRWGMAPIVYQSRKAFRPVELYSVGYTNHPNIPGSYIGLNEALPGDASSAETTTTPPMNPLLLKLLAALGIELKPDATEADITAALQGALDKIAADSACDTEEATAASNELATAKAALTAATNEAAAHKAAFTAERQLRADGVLVLAINTGRLTAAQRADWEPKLLTAATNEAFTAVAAELAALQPAVNTASKTPNLGARRGQPDPEGKKRIIAINEAIDAKVKATPGLTRDAAFLALQQEKPALFTPAQS